MRATGNERLMVQLELVSEGRHLVTWVAQGLGLRVGNIVTLGNHAEPERRWEILAVGAPKPAGEIKHTWHNDI